MSESTILESLKIYRKYLNGDDSKVEVVDVPVPIKIQFNAQTIKSLRNKTGQTQAELAKLIGVSTRTVESWESNRSEPNRSAQKLLTLLINDSTMINKLRCI